MHLDHHLAQLARVAATRLAGVHDALERHVAYSGDLLAARADLSVAAMRAARDLAPALRAPGGTVPAAALAQELVRIVDPISASDLSRDVAVFDDLWTAHQRPVFAVSASLAATLLLTDPGRVLERDVAWPFPAFRIVLPHPEPRVAFTHADGATEIAARSIDVIRWELLRGDAPAREVPLPVWRGDAAAFQKAIDLFSIDVGPEMAQRAEPGVCVRVHGDHHMSVYANAPWRGDVEVEDWMRRREHGLNPTHGPLLDDYALTEADRRALALGQRLAVNLALYLASARDGGDAPVWTPAAKTTGRGRRWEVGREVRIAPEVRRAATEVAAGRAATAPAVKHVVRGHFRNQACGAGRAERRRIYVAPHWRGGDLDAAPARRYAVS